MDETQEATIGSEDEQTFAETEDLSFAEYAKMFHEDTIRHNEVILNAAHASVERLYSTLRRIAEERYEQDILLIRAVELLSHVVNNATPSKHGITEDFIESIRQYLQSLK